MPDLEQRAAELENRVDRLGRYLGVVIAVLVATATYQLLHDSNSNSDTAISLAVVLGFVSLVYLSSRFKGM